MTKKLERIWISSEAKKCLKIKAASKGQNMVDAFDDLVKDSKAQKERWGRLF